VVIRKFRLAFLGAAVGAASVCPTWAEEPGPAPARSSHAALLMPVLAQSDDTQLQLDVLKGIHAALEGQRQAQAPAGWGEVYAKLSRSQSAELRSLTRALAATFGDPRALADMRELLQDGSADAKERGQVLQSLLVASDPALPQILHKLVAEPALRDGALQALAAYDDAATPAVILAAYESFDINSRRVALNTLAGRIEYARPLAAAVRGGKVPKQDLTAFTIRQLRDLDDADLNQFVTEVYGVAREASADKAAEIARFKAFLTDARLADADPARGRVLFNTVCAQCHTLYGEGGTVGPDLTGSQRANLDYVLQNVVDPSALISNEFQVTLIRTKDKRVVSGIASDLDHAVKVVTEAGTVLVPKDEIDKQRRSELSMMPEGLFNGRTEAEIADLVAYLRTTEQVSLPDDAAPAKAE
jgi:putative heme-binding domain-containing protein